MYDEMIDLFVRYNFTVDQIDERSYVAKSEMLGLAVVSSPYIHYGRCEASAVTYPMNDIDKVIDRYIRTKTDWDTIGSMAYSPLRGSIFDTARYHGGLYNHDYNTWEVERWLKQVSNIMEV